MGDQAPLRRRHVQEVRPGEGSILKACGVHSCFPEKEASRRPIRKLLQYTLARDEKPEPTQCQ